jgi:hypothetical protein
VSQSEIWHLIGTGTRSLNADVELPLLWEWAVMRPGTDTKASLTACVHQAFMSSESNFRKVSVGSCRTGLGRNILRERANLITASRKRIIKKDRAEVWAGFTDRNLPRGVARRRALILSPVHQLPHYSSNPNT